MTAQPDIQTPGTDQTSGDDQTMFVGAGPDLPTPAKADPIPIPPAPGWGPLLYDPGLYLMAAQLDNAEQLRIAVENRHRMATRDVADSDGHVRGLGLDESVPAVAVSAQMLNGLKKIEHAAELALCRTLRAHPLGPWQKAQVGIGEKQLARLLATIGDPYWNDLHDRPRTVSQLWAYAGLHVLPAGSQSMVDTHIRSAAGGPPSSAPPPGQKRTDIHSRTAGMAARRQRGQRANWSATAKSRAWLIAASCIKQATSPYRAVYDKTRLKYEDVTHVAPCAQCGAKGKPAPVGSALRPGHQHARALRAVSKEVLKDLWIESRRLHDQTGDLS